MDDPLTRVAEIPVRCTCVRNWRRDLGLWICATCHGNCPWCSKRATQAISEAAWKPRGCPIARHQPLGYTHWHTETCQHATPEQITADAAQQQALHDQRPWRRFLRAIHVTAARPQTPSVVTPSIPGTAPVAYDSQRNDGPGS